MGGLAIESVECSDLELAPFDIKAMRDEIRTAYEELAEIGTKLEGLHLFAVKEDYNRLQDEWDLAFGKFIDSQTEFIAGMRQP